MVVRSLLIKWGSYKELNLFSEEIYLSSNQEDIINKDKNYAEEYLILEALN